MDATDARARRGHHPGGPKRAAEAGLRNLAGMARACLFCGAEGGLTKEHVFPRWLRRALSLSEGRLQMSFGPTVLRDALEVTLREVCGECNNGWLHDLEQAFRASMLPAIEGQPTASLVLSMPSQEVVAIWAVKTWFLAERALLHFRGAAVESDGIPMGLRSTNQPPNMTQVWIGQMEPGHSITLATVAVWNDAGVPRGTLGMMVIGGLVLVVYAVIEEIDGMWQGLSIEPTSAFAQVWPHETEEVLWPPPTVLTEEVLRDIFATGERVTV